MKAKNLVKVLIYVCIFMAAVPVKGFTDSSLNNKIQLQEKIIKEIKEQGLSHLAKKKSPMIYAHIFIPFPNDTIHSYIMVIKRKNKIKFFRKTSRRLYVSYPLEDKEIDSKSYDFFKKEFDGISNLVQIADSVTYPSPNLPIWYILFYDPIKKKCLIWTKTSDLPEEYSTEKKMISDFVTFLYREAL